MGRLTVIAPVKGEEAMTELTLRSLRAFCGGAVGRVMVVDNSPDNATRKRLDALRWSAVERVVGAPDLSFSAACNRGADEADEGTLLFLNNDVESRADWLTPLRALHRETGALVSATLTYPDGRLQHAGEALPMWGNPFILGDGGDVNDSRYSGVRRRWAAIAALLLIDRSLFEEVGGFEEGYRFGLEDVDLCLKAGEAGRPTLVAARTGIIHHTSQTVTKLPTAERQATVAANNTRFAERWGGMIEERQAVYCEGLRTRGVERLVIAGAGRAAAMAGGVLVRHGLTVAGYLDDTEAVLPDDAPEAPMVGYDDAKRLGADAILPASGGVGRYRSQTDERRDNVDDDRPRATSRLRESYCHHYGGVDRLSGSTTFSLRRHNPQPFEDDERTDLS